MNTAKGSAKNSKDVQKSLAQEWADKFGGGGGGSGKRQVRWQEVAGIK